MKLADFYCPNLSSKLFEEYDCQPQHSNLFQKLIISIQKVAGNRPGETLVTLNRDVASRTEVLASILNAIKPNAPFRKTLLRITINQKLALHCLLQCLRDCTRQKEWRDPSEEVAKVSRRLQHLVSCREVKQKLALAVKAFNESPKHCLKRLTELNVINSADDVDGFANFLRTTPGIDLELLGEHLAKGEEWNRSLRHAFISQLSFRGDHQAFLLSRSLQVFPFSQHSDSCSQPSSFQARASRSTESLKPLERSSSSNSRWSRMLHCIQPPQIPRKP